MPDKNPNATHATKGSSGDYCCRCSSALGPTAKRQPTRCDGESYCPRCFVWWRMRQESLALGVDGDTRGAGRPRFQAHQAAACRCQFCEWEVISFGAKPGESLRCGHCGKPGCIRLPIDDASMEELQEQIASAQEAVRKAS